MRNTLPGCWLMSGMGWMVRTGRGRERARAEVAVVRVLEKRLGALPVVAEFGRRLRIAEIVDELCPVRPGLCRIFLDGYGAGVSAGSEDARAEQRECGAAVHLAFDQLGAGVEAFYQAGAPGQGQGVADGLLVLADA